MLIKLHQNWSSSYKELRIWQLLPKWVKEIDDNDGDDPTVNDDVTSVVEELLDVDDGSMDVPDLIIGMQSSHHHRF